MLSFIIVLLIVLLLVYELFYNRKLKECAKRLPGFPLIPFLGNAHQLKPTPTGFLNFLVKTSEYGKVARFMIGSRLFVVITDPDDIEFVTTDIRLTTKSSEYDLLREWLGDGLINSGGTKWKTRRKLLTPSFHFNILKDYIPIFEKYADIFVRKLGEKSGEIVDVYPLIGLCTLDAISETAMGVKLNAQLGQHAEYVKAVADISVILIGRIVGLWSKFDFIFKLMPIYKQYKKQLNILHTMTNKVIKERRKAFEKKLMMNGHNREDDGIKRRQPFLDTLLSSETINGRLSDEDIREEVDTFMFAGHDTTTSTLGFLFYNMAMNPEIQEKVYQEQLSIFSDDPNREISHEDFNKMKYMEMVIKESMRMHPTVAMFNREATFDFNLNGTEIPAGCSILLNTYSMCRNPEVFPDPMRFIPERFSLEESSKRHPFGIITFSAGQRNCIGQRFALTEVKCIFSKCIREIEFLPGIKELELGTDLVLKSFNGINLEIKKRCA